MRDGASVNELANYLCRIGFGNTQITSLESLGSTNQKITKSYASDLEEEFMHPVMVALDISGDG